MRKKQRWLQASGNLELAKEFIGEAASSEWVKLENADAGSDGMPTSATSDGVVVDSVGAGEAARFIPDPRNVAGEDFVLLIWLESGLADLTLMKVFSTTTT
mmetsp:Transcript_68684/g.128140  ORF Transcript_68684/g.128140 Transcript_68684/m.128140 type:complete len:101 (-) Transcript_68684:476-778(-)